MAQSKRLGDDGFISKLSVKKSKELIVKFNGRIDADYQKEDLNDVYILNNGQAVLLFETHGFLFVSFDSFKNWISLFKEKQKRQSTSHILECRLLYGEKFVEHIPALVDTICVMFNLINTIPSMESLKMIEVQINNKQIKIKVDEILFSGIVAYVGEIIRRKSGGQWEMMKAVGFSRIWEPYIVLSEKKYNPFFLVYRELFEEFPENRNVSFSDRLLFELAE